MGFGGGAGVGGGVGSARPRESGGAALLHPNAAGVATMETQPEQDGDDDVANGEFPSFSPQSLFCTGVFIPINREILRESC